ncbi:unnamed protein product [Rotaria sordida]|uniref:F-box domain-containing protein n=1 Tax=Rotaria sordida TaxID=392033 RepID=A0A813W8K6_9BILA|nr:unnamed protein product [Rotaria sordida]CAF0857382.1 unnamed protein product [Rotaria sordida]
MFLDNLPHHALYNLCKYLCLIDIINLSRTCKRLYILIEKDNYFWMILIKNHFGSKLYQLYVNEIFQNKKNSDYVLYRTDKDREKFEKSFRNNLPRYVCNIWLFNVLNCKDNSDGYLTYKSVLKRKFYPRTNELKMSLTIEEFFEHYFNKNKKLTKENIFQISLCKLIYFYLIEPKRLLGVDMCGIYLRCSKYHLHCFNSICSKNHEYDLNSLTGQCVRLYSDELLYQSGIKGKFKSILPGIYDIICRIKLDKNDKYLPYYNECCSQDPSVEKCVECYFYALADYGLDCECDGKMDFDWFESKYLLHSNVDWFNETMGRIKVFELSDIYFGFHIRYEFRYRNILFDYIQLNIVK